MSRRDPSWSSPRTASSPASTSSSDDPPELIAGKLLRVNLSDLAAMGATPLGYLTVLARPPGLTDAWLRRFASGLAADQKRFGLHLLGGDTVSTPGPLTLTLTILGTVPEGQALRRSGARPGDEVWVSGTLGDAAMGLRVLRGLALPEDEALQLSDRYRTPQPRLELGRALPGPGHRRDRRLRRPRRRPRPHRRRPPA